MLKKGISVILCALMLGMFSLATAETLVLEMTANPTTGYDWNFVVADEAIATVDAKFASAADLNDNAEMLSGAGGLYTFTVKGVAAGETVIAFEYMQLQDETTTVVGLTYSVHVDEDLNVTITGATVGV